ncbi:hypothetical protein NMY22_g6050 [Coprinellus aureogranulatus]|nr:hypothetical protein NMY22_g6050 [Coprinellus aureogranulatus]
MSAPLPCLDPNPDISGIGVRVSIYIQAFLNILCAMVFSRDSWISKTEHKSLTQASLNLFLAGCALLVCTIVQGSTFGITVHHALIVLNLNWIVGFSALLYVFIWTYNLVIGRVGRRRRREWLHSSAPDVDFGHRGDAALFLLSAVHLSGTGAVGVWLWKTISKFGDQPKCTPATLYTLFGRSVHVVGQGSKGLRRASLAVYWTMAIPIANVLILILISWIVIAFLGLLYTALGKLPYKTPVWQTYILFSGISLIALLDILFIVDTELMISSSAAIVKEGEGQWSFGQTLALVALIVPLVDTVKMLRRSVKETEDGTERRGDEIPRSVGRGGEREIALRTHTSSSTRSVIGHPQDAAEVAKELEDGFQGRRKPIQRSNSLP